MWTIFAAHVVAWAMGLGMFAWLSVYVVPRYERTIADYKLALPYPTMLLLLAAANARAGGLFVLLVPVAIAHSLAAALWLRRGGRGRRAVYRLVVTLVLGAAVLFVLLGLFLPMVGLWNSLGGAGGSKK
jgi:type II secretory pathway component PulF